LVFESCDLWPPDLVGAEVVADHKPVRIDKDTKHDSADAIEPEGERDGHTGDLRPVSRSSQPAKEEQPEHDHDQAGDPLV